jgi:glycosyltransferase involved in cell wall biosynthesis
MIFKFSGYWADYIRYKRLAKREVEIFRITKYFSGRTDWDRRIIKLMSQSSIYYHCEEMLRPSFYINQWCLPEKSDTIRLISVINPNMYKGIETILETAKLLKTYSNRQVFWIIAGVAKESPLVKIFNRKTKINAQSVNVEFLGPVQEASLVKKMLDSDIFIHASHIDNSPNSLCEAMVLGMPIISTNVGGIQSLLTDSKEGILVQDGEAFGLAGAIIELINSPAKRTAYGDAARQRAVERHDPIKIVNQQLFIYQDILNNHDKKNSGTAYLLQQEG